MVLTNVNAAFLLLEQSHWKCSAQLPSRGLQEPLKLPLPQGSDPTEQQQGTSGSEVLSHEQPDYFH